MAAEKKARWGAIPLAGLIGAVATGLVDYLFARSAGRVPALKDVWWAVFLVPIAAAYLASLLSWGKRMGTRVAAGISTGALVGLGYGFVNAFLTPLVPGLAEAAVANGSAVLLILWRTFIFALLAIPGAFLAETRRP